MAAVVSLLATLSLPAIRSAREVARRSSCQNHLRQLGLALQTYHDTHRSLPPAALWGSEGLDLPDLISHKNPTPVHVTRQNWLWFLLPHLDESELADKFDWTVPTVHPRNAEARTSELALMRCPSDTNSTPENHYRLETADGATAEFARGNYAINGGSEYVPALFGNLSNPGPTENRFRYSEAAREFQWWGNGIAGINKCFTFDEFENGLSTTVGLEELRAGVVPEDPRGVWAFGQIGGSITWGHGITGDDGGPNYGYQTGLYDKFGKPGYVGADDIFGGPQLSELLSVEQIESERMQFCRYCNENTQATARSQHPGGIQLIMLDGSVRFVSDNVDTGLWHSMHSRETPKDRFLDRFESDLLVPLSLADGPDRKRAPGESSKSDQRPPRFNNSIGMTFVRVPHGEFVMGLPNQGNQFPYPLDAVPHKVRLTHDYHLAVHEVTQGQFQEVMGYHPSWHAPTGGGHDVITLSDTSACPVENVSWDAAADFCRRLSELPAEKAADRTYRLPTEAEWEYACRAGRTEPMELDTSWEVVNTGETASKKAPDVRLLTEPVGSYPPNPFGLHDMCGNVYEWVADYRAEGYYAHSPLEDPQGPAYGYLRVIRGWYWVATGPACKVYVTQEPSKGSHFIGFRVICE